MLGNHASYDGLRRAFRWQIPERYNIGVDCCDKWACGRDRVALIHVLADGAVVEWTFRELEQQSNQAANLLLDLGIERGDRVSVLLPQIPETAIAHLAIYKLGAIAVPLSSLFGPEAIEYRLRDSGTRAVVTDAPGAAKLAGMRDRLPALGAVLTVDGRARDCVDWAALVPRHSGRFQPIDTLAEDPALIIYTSGTTGQPKGALHAHRVLLGHLPGVEMSHDLMPQVGDRFWTPADWAWIGGLYDVLFPAWHHGLPVVAHRFAKFDPEAAFRLIADLGIRNAFLPPTALKMMRTVSAPHRRWKLDMRSIASGGEPLGKELIEWGREVFGITINEFYGQTECNMVVSSAGTLMEARPGRLGRPVPGHDVAIVTPDGTPCAPGVIGTIAVRRPDPVMFLGYWNNDAATQQKFAGDWLLSGDTGEVDEAGFIRFVGRDDDVIKSAGYRIGPAEIEDCLLGHPAIKLAAVVGVPDPLRAQAVKAYIVLHAGIEASVALREEVQSFVRTRLSAHEYPREIEFIDSLPMTTTGKIIRRELRERAARAVDKTQ